MFACEMSLQRDAVGVAPGGDHPEKVAGEELRTALQIEPLRPGRLRRIAGRREEQRIDLLHCEPVAPPELLRQQRRPGNMFGADRAGEGGLVGEDSADGPTELLRRGGAVAFVDEAEKFPGRIRIQEIAPPAGGVGGNRSELFCADADQHPGGEFRVAPDHLAAGGAAGPAAFVIEDQQQTEPAAFVDHPAEVLKIALPEVGDPHPGMEVAGAEVLRHRMQTDRTESRVAHRRELTRHHRFGRIAVPVPEDPRICIAPERDGGAACGEW